MIFTVPILYLLRRSAIFAEWKARNLALQWQPFFLFVSGRNAQVREQVVNSMQKLFAISTAVVPIRSSQGT